MKEIALNDQQKQAAEAPRGPLLIVAGAGTGKTRTLMSRILFFILKGIQPRRICAITFTNKAASEMQERLKNLSKTRENTSNPQDIPINSTEKPLIGTFHSLGSRILRRECRLLRREPNFTIFDDHDSMELLKKALKVLPDTSHSSLGGKKEPPRMFMEAISNKKNLGRFSSKPGVVSGNDERFERVYDRYEALLEENNAFDFDDLIEKVVTLWQRYPNVLLKYQMMFDAVLVDEYQDINPKQHELVRLLASGHKNLSVVGDDEQTIYGWRHADIAIFLNFEKEWPGATVYFLEENYRSTGSVIRAAASVVKNNRIRAPKNLWTKNEDGALIVLYEAWGENEEAAWMGEEIRKIKAKSPKESVAVLYRTNAQSRAIEQAFIRREISYRIYGGLKFYERREVKDIVAGIRYAANPRDALSRERLEKNLTKRKFSVFKNAIEGMEKIIPEAVITAFVDAFAYFEYVDENFTNADERRENIAELVSFASGFQDINELLERFSLLQATDDENRSGENRVQPEQTPVTLMTIHMSKGLEFDAVFIAGASEGLLPHARSTESESSTEEERRLMYVAMTRARARLYISFSGMPSRFVGEIPEEYVEWRVAGASNSQQPRTGDDGYRVSTDDEEYVYY